MGYLIQGVVMVRVTATVDRTIGMIIVDSAETLKYNVVQSTKG